MAKKPSANAQARYTTYKKENHAESNKVAKIARHAKKHPNDSQAVARAKNAFSGKTHEKQHSFAKLAAKAVLESRGGRRIPTDSPNFVKKTDNVIYVGDDIQLDPVGKKVA